MRIHEAQILSRQFLVALVKMLKSEILAILRKIGNIERTYLFDRFQRKNNLVHVSSKQLFVNLFVLPAERLRES